MVQLTTQHCEKGLPRPSVNKAKRLHFLRILILPLSIIAGCGPRRPEWMIPPPLEPKAIAGAVMNKADANGDGELDKRELAALPALRGAMNELDTNGDGHLSSSEVESWLTSIKNEQMAFYEASLKVTQFGQPVPDAIVTLVPEACMGSGIEAARGITDDTGLTFLNIDGAATFGVRGGLYRLTITGTLPDGTPIPAQYNTATTLGLAIGGGLPQPRTPTIILD